MLVICNGAIKSGSTWLYNVLERMRTFEAPPDEYLTMGNPRHPCIRPKKLSRFLARVDFASRDYLSKNHYSAPEHRDLLVATPDVYVFDIERDPRDVAVSHYYHECFRNGFEGDFAEFYWSTGREVVAKLSRYHAMWRDAGPRCYVASYERLHNEFDDEVRRIAGVLGQAPTDEDIERIRAETSLASLRKGYENEPRFEGKKFFRKGAIGDWVNHFDDDTLRDIERITTKGIGVLDRARLRRRIRALLNR